jgi:hypothetical protein
MMGTYAVVNYSRGKQDWFIQDSEQNKPHQSTPTRPPLALTPVATITTLEFTYQVWLKPYSLHSNTRQGVLGEVVDSASQQLNSGLHIDDEYIHFFVGQNFDKRCKQPPANSISHACPQKNADVIFLAGPHRLELFDREV